MVSSYPRDGVSPRIKISLFLISICTDELISDSEIMIYFPMLLSLNTNSVRESNSISYLLYSYLSRSKFLVSLTDPYKHLFNVKSVIKFFNHEFSV